MTIPLKIVTPELTSGALVDWLEDHKETMTTFINQYGGVLLRGFKISSTSNFNKIAQLICSELKHYVFRSTPRRNVGGKIYTSTEYPADQAIPLHNENAYSNHWPRHIMFYSAVVAETGGQTPIANMADVYGAIPAEIRAAFLAKKILYVRHYHPGFDLDWQSVFQTSDKGDVESYCKNNGINFEWKDNVLVTKQVCAAVIEHPNHQVPVWFNQAHLFHVSSLNQQVERDLLNTFGEEALPRNAYFGDASPIPRDYLDAIRDAIQQNQISFDWQLDDVMILDNCLYAHGRAPYEGKRKVLVAMA